MSWADIPGWTCSRLLELYDEIGETRDGGTVVEVGCAYGRSLAYLAQRCAANVRIVGVDVWDEFMGGDNLPADVFERLRAHGSPYAACDAELRASNIRHRVQLYRCTSVQGAKNFADAGTKVDFAFLDDEHTYEALGRGIRAWLPRMKPGAILAGHDFNDHYPGVEQAVREELGEDVEIRRNVDGWGGVWIHRVAP